MDLSDPKSLALPDPKGEFPFAPPEYLWLLVYSIARLRDNQIEQLLKPLGLTNAKHRALLTIRHFSPITMSELADVTLVERTTMTRTVDQLVAEGLVERRTPPKDRRQVVLEITDAGRRLVGRAARLIVVKNREDLEGIDDASLRALVRHCQDVAANLAPDAQTRERLLTFTRPEAQASSSRSSS